MPVMAIYISDSHKKPPQLLRVDKPIANVSQIYLKFNAVVHLNFMIMPCSSALSYLAPLYLSHLIKIYSSSTLFHIGNARLSKSTHHIVSLLRDGVGLP